MKSLRYRLVLALVAPALAVMGTGCSSGSSDPVIREHGNPDLTSDLRIEPAKSFLLGGGQPRPFFIDAFNKGTTTVVVTGELGGKTTAVCTLAPGQRASHQFAAGEMAVLKNESAQAEGRLDVRVWGNPSSLGMTYRGN